MTEDPPATLLPWDTAFFGFAIAKVRAARLNAADLPVIEGWRRSHEVRCLYFLADSTSPETLECAFKGGFQFVDMRWDLELSASRAAAIASTESVIREATESDLVLHIEQARILHTNTRFFKDPQFSPDRAAGLYSEWLRRSFREPRKRVLTAMNSSGSPAGYIACEHDGEGTGRIGLIGVAEGAQGQGLGAALVRAAAAWLCSEGVQKIRVATQADNLPALKLYIAAGFTPAETGAWFHRWYS